MSLLEDKLDVGCIDGCIDGEFQLLLAVDTAYNFFFIFFCKSHHRLSSKLHTS